MIIFSVTAFIPHVTKEQVTDFFIHCTVPQYQKWWPGVHLELYTMKRIKNELGSIIYFDEYVGNHRLKFKSKITKYERGKIIEYQMIKGCALPALLVMEFTDMPNGVQVTHTLKVGYNGMGKIFDFFLRFYLSASFEKQLSEHVKEEFLKLGNILNG